uniref:Uncharacterized protein n=1 Tax=Molossus molossus TaxID=27622 RepID=A0A7J8J7R1_MOLMO|nr:hypothetical protein HJG59_009652 [Molossus molossus]
MYLIDIYRELHLKTSEFTFFSSAHGTFSKIDHLLGHNLNIYKFKKIEILSSIFSDHNGIQLEINCNKIMQRHLKTWRPNSMLLRGKFIVLGADLKKQEKFLIDYVTSLLKELQSKRKKKKKILE